MTPDTIEVTETSDLVIYIDPNRPNAIIHDQATDLELEMDDASTAELRRLLERAVGTGRYLA